MKTKKLSLTIVGSCAVTLLASQAQASWYQEYCSDGAGTVTMADGHNDAFLRGTKRTWVKGDLKDERVDLEDMEIEVVKQQELENTSARGGCFPGLDSGWISWREVTYKKIKITNPKGTKFSEHMVGVTADGTALEASLLCELNGSSDKSCADGDK